MKPSYFSIPTYLVIRIFLCASLTRIYRTQASGTSASAPVITGMISLVNSARLSEGKPPVGFINTALYQIGTSVANDIIFGKNSCTGDGP